MFHVPNQWRVRAGKMASDDKHGNNGAFILMRPHTGVLNVIASDGAGWEHVSVSLPNRCPDWDDMCFIKGVFWDEEDCVVQFHPPRSQYVNKHPNCLHLWRQTDTNIITPPMWMIG